MNRKNAVNELVRVLSAEYMGENIYPEHNLESKALPNLVVSVASEQSHESIPLASELDVELIIEINDEDGGGVDMGALQAFICDSGLKALIEAGELLTVHRVEMDATEIEREANTTKETLAFKMWIFGGSAL